MRRINVTRDLSPIDQTWIQAQCDLILVVVEKLPDGSLRDALLRRVECYLDLAEAWQNRNQS